MISTKRSILCVLLCITLYVCCECVKTTDTNEIKGVKTTSIVKNASNVQTTEKQPEKRSNNLICPSQKIQVPFFSPTCKSLKDCKLFSKDMVCCNRRCIIGVEPPHPEPTHSSVFGIERVCPADPIPEFFDIKECHTDADCGIRICCPERSTQGHHAKNYCRSPAPRFNKMPTVKQMLLPLKALMGYLQCMPPPPPLLDIFPKECRRPFDCFPNLCCQENGNKYCRPPKKSILALLVTTAQRVGSSDFAKNFIQRIS